MDLAGEILAEKPSLEAEGMDTVNQVMSSAVRDLQTIGELHACHNSHSREHDVSHLGVLQLYSTGNLSCVRDHR